jgi:hypothetical protein
VVVRCTAKALKLLGLHPSSLAEITPAADDWYLNLLWLDGRKCLLLTHASTNFSVFVPDIRKADLNPVGPFLTDAITAALDADALPRDSLGPLDASNVQLAKTASRRVLGIMNETAAHVDYILDRDRGLLDVDTISVNQQLQRTLHSDGHGDYATPIELVRQRISGKTQSQPLSP